jgi:hemerythrin superfamily protein
MSASFAEFIFASAASNPFLQLTDHLRFSLMGTHCMLLFPWRSRKPDNSPMLRNKNLIPLSHQHQHALALCVRIDRALQAGDVDLAAWQDEIRQIGDQEITIHFQAEEKHLFPAGEHFAELGALVTELRHEHELIREHFVHAAARQMSREELGVFAVTLAAHVRKEERRLFEQLQQLAAPTELDRLGKALQEALAGANDACLLPNQSTRLRAQREIETRDE